MKKIMFLFLILFISIISVNAKTGSITIRRYDDDGKKISSELLKSTKVKLFKSNCLIMTLRFDENSQIIINDLEFGEYKIEEEVAPVGYDLDTREYVIYLSESKDHMVNLSSKKIGGTLIINKYYNINNTYLLDNESAFEVYKNNELIKTMIPINGVISEKLEYGNYLIKQVKGKKYYEFVDEFNVSITKSQNYKFDLYSDMETELKEIFNSKENEINNKYQELIEIENNLINLKNELESKKNNLSIEKEKLENDKKQLEKLSQEINDSYNELNNKTNEIKKVEEELKLYKQQLDLLRENLNIENNDLNKLKLSLNKKEEELNNLKNELDILNNVLIQKENNLKNLINKINNKELELNKREEELMKIKNKKNEDTLIVEVPNTYKKNYNKLLSKILIIIGSLFMVYSKRKVTIH